MQGLHCGAACSYCPLEWAGPRLESHVMTPGFLRYCLGRIHEREVQSMTTAG